MKVSKNLKKLRDAKYNDLPIYVRNDFKNLIGNICNEKKPKSD